MYTQISVILFSAALFLAVILFLALNSKTREKVLGFVFLISASGGIIMYGLIYSKDSVGSVSAVFKTVIAVGRMFTGVNDAPALAKVFGDNVIITIVFWTLHFMAYYSIAGAAILVLGEGLLRQIKLLLLRVRDIDLVYGVSDKTVSFAGKIAGNRKSSLVFIGNADAGQIKSIKQMGGLVYGDAHAMLPDAELLKRIYVKKGKSRLNLYAISDDIDLNLDYAEGLLKVLEAEEILPEQTKLVLLGREEIAGGEYQAYNDKYGYGTVRVFEKSELLARLLIKSYPIVDTVTFDETGKATNDVNALLVGFGKTGQEILKKIIANGQFEGSNFSAQIFDPNINSIDGFFNFHYSPMLKNYNLSFVAKGGRSREFCDYVRENALNISYIVVCVGNERLGREISVEIMDLLKRFGVRMPVYHCIKEDIYRYEPSGKSDCVTIYDDDILFNDRLDEFAMEINHFYCGNDETKEKQWKKLDYFSRMSSRASADFLETFLDRQGIKDGNIPEEKAWNFAKTEHLRWNAFHFTMGFSTMPDEELNKRIEEYKTDNKVRITNNKAKRHHACLTDWDDLDRLSKLVTDATGKETDYKQMDLENIKAVAGLLKENKGVR